MSNFTETEIQQILLTILDAATGHEADTGIRKRNPAPIQLPNGRKVDISAAAPISEGVGIELRDHTDPDDCLGICLRIDRQITPFDIMEMGVKMGLAKPGVSMKSGRLLKQSESLPVPDQVH